MTTSKSYEYFREVYAKNIYEMTWVDSTKIKLIEFVDLDEQDKRVVTNYYKDAIRSNADNLYDIIEYASVYYDIWKRICGEDLSSKNNSSSAPDNLTWTIIAAFLGKKDVWQHLKRCAANEFMPNQTGVYQFRWGDEDESRYDGECVSVIMRDAGWDEVIRETLEDDQIIEWLKSIASEIKDLDEQKAKAE